MNYEIKVLSPVHIGTGKQITPFEFICTDGRLVVIDLEKVVEANPQRVEELNTRLSRDALHFSLSAFLAQAEQTNASFRKYSAALDETTQAALQAELRKARDMDVDEYIKTVPDSQVYIPGSSLKGVFRTALAYSIFRTDEKLYQELKKRLENVDWRWSDEAVNELIFWGANDPKYDLFKTLRFSDSSTLPADEHTLAIGKMKLLSLTSARKREPPKQGTMFKQLQQLKETLVPTKNPLKPWWTFQEILQPGIAFTGDISLEDRLLHDPKAQAMLQWQEPHQTGFSLDKLIQAANTFSKDACNWELNFFERYVQGIDATPVLDFYHDLKKQLKTPEPNSCYLCIGQGAGWHKMTIGMLLERDKDFDFRKLRQDLRLADERLNFEYPKSRKLLMDSDEKIKGVFGWVKVRLIP
jgi:CRISPR/Cas system CSM-associated protein Csm5 (group 7 of RAMP superfamily)